MSISELRAAVRQKDVSRISSICRVLSVKHDVDVIFNIAVLSTSPEAIRNEVSRVESLVA